MWFSRTVSIALCSADKRLLLISVRVMSDMTQLTERSLKPRTNLCFGSWVLCCFCYPRFGCHRLCPGNFCFQNVAEEEYEHFSPTSVRSQVAYCKASPTSFQLLCLDFVLMLVRSAGLLCSVCRTVCC